MCVGTVAWVESKRLEMMDPESRERQVIFIVIIIVDIIIIMIRSREEYIVIVIVIANVIMIGIAWGVNRA